MSAPFVDWAGLMRLGLSTLRLPPDTFWALTPAELAVMAGVDPASSPAMARARLAELSAAYPDATPDKGDGHDGQD
ncbi:rcc01693 family protein [Roseobacter sp. HKCCA0434]|uniref:rcc01693 family protein n=1 Tax=Roseobacter sp. HKCCA0434 TaxID=3079297 RepID=UPI002905A679|nr:rcc01693 family protein [Roseobacter sp. HKCCA0434]